MTEFLAAIQHDVAPFIAAVLLHALWQCALLAVAAASALRTMANASAARRHKVAMAFLVAMLLVPAATAPWFEVEGIFLLQGSSWMPAIAVLLWLAGAVPIMVRHIASLRTIAALERGVYEPLPEPWLQRVDALKRKLAIAAAVSVRLSKDVLVPCTARLMRPVVWLPLSLLTRAPAEQLEALLAHELAHIARKDWLWNGIQSVVECVLFFHPAVWWLGRRIREEREHASDDLAISACGDAVVLAEALAALEHHRHAPAALAITAGGGRLLQRIARLISDEPAKQPWLRPALAGAVIVALALSLPEAGLAGGRVPALSVSSSTTGELGAGDFREITARDGDTIRSYRVSIGADGRIDEVYREDGRIRPIDADVRRWIDEVERMPPDGK